MQSTFGTLTDSYNHAEEGQCLPAVTGPQDGVGAGTPAADVEALAATLKPARSLAEALAAIGDEPELRAFLLSVTPGGRIPRGQKRAVRWGRNRTAANASRCGPAAFKVAGQRPGVNHFAGCRRYNSPMPCFGQEVSFADDVLQLYRCDFTLIGKPDLQARYDAADEAGRRAILRDVLRKPIPDDGLHWTYQELTPEMVAPLLMPCTYKSTVAQFMDRAAVEPVRLLEREHGLNGTIARINDYAGRPDCGQADVYRTMIVARKQGAMRIYDGTHRLGALWKRFTADNWPSGLGVFVGDVRR